MKKVLEKIGFENVEELKKAVYQNDEIAKDFLELVQEFLKLDLEKNLVDFKTLDLNEYLKASIGFEKNEVFKMICLNNKNQIVFDEIVFQGTINRSVVYPRKIVEILINTKARGVIFVHNHPSGDLTPSKKDISFLEELENLLEAIDVLIIDNIIVSDNNYYSFKENGILY